MRVWWGGMAVYTVIREYALLSAKSNTSLPPGQTLEVKLDVIQVAYKTILLTNPNSGIVVMLTHLIVTMSTY